MTVAPFLKDHIRLGRIKYRRQRSCHRSALHLSKICIAAATAPAMMSNALRIFVIRKSGFPADGNDQLA
ncbi:MAG TPA: hypothetical protein VFE62_00035 [Gemmataceae bacterium]|nr:hypothetical protein [Gemmataceae bacterium]